MDHGGARPVVFERNYCTSASAAQQHAVTKQPPCQHHLVCHANILLLITSATTNMEWRTPGHGRLQQHAAAKHAHQPQLPQRQHKFSAGRSHEANAEYMGEFRTGITKMYLELENPTPVISSRETSIDRQHHGPSCSVQRSRRAQSRSTAGAPPSSSLLALAKSEAVKPVDPSDRIRQRQGLGARDGTQQQKGKTCCWVRNSPHSFPAEGWHHGDSGIILGAQQAIGGDTRWTNSGDGFETTVEEWYSGPADPAGEVQMKHRG